MTRFLCHSIEGRGKRNPVEPVVDVLASGARNFPDWVGNSWVERRKTLVIILDDLTRIS
jgi:hypothetical protein